MAAVSIVEVTPPTAPGLDAATISRIESLEQQMTALSEASGVNNLSNGAGGTDLVVAREIRLVNAAGKSVISLVSDDFGGVISIFNGTENLVASLSASANGGDMAIYNNTGKNAASISVEKNGGYLSAKNNAGETASAFYSGENGGWMSILNKSGDEVVQAYADDGTEGYVGVWNREGKGRTLRPR